MMLDKKRILFVSITILLVVLLVAGGTFAILSASMNITNGSYRENFVCFNINYDMTNDDNTVDITGDLFPSSNFGGGLSGSVSLGLDSNCDIAGVGIINLNVSAVDSILSQVVDAHCEDSSTLSTMGEYATSASCTSGGGVWVTNGSALKYAVSTGINVTPISVGYVTGTGDFSLISSIPLTNTLTKYYVYVWLDGNISDSTYENKNFNGYIYASARQIEG